MSRIPAAGPIQQSSPGTAGANDFRNVDIDQFLKLLLAELQNQDPLDPMDNAEILQQISQIREISATNKLSETLDAVLLGQNVNTASSLIGKQLHALTDDAEDIVGIVDRVSVEVRDGENQDRVLRVHIGDHSIRLDNIREIIGGDGAEGQ